jgi:hypothetical protein
MLALADLSRNDWSTRMLRERAELEAFAEREQQVREARRRAERQRASNTTAARVEAIDVSMFQHIKREAQTMCEATGEVLAQVRAEVRKEFRDKDRALEARIAARQSLAKNFKFARDLRRRGGKPARNRVRKIH